MTTEKKNIADALRDAGYKEPSQFVENTDQIIAKLPMRRKRSLKERFLQISAAAAALVLFMMVGMPGVVKAAEAIINRLFNQRAQQIEQKLVLPEDERLQQAVEGYYGGNRHHAIAASADFMGVTIQLKEIYLAPYDRYNAESADGHAKLWLSFSKTPSFDINHLTFKLRMNGQEYNPEEGLLYAPDDDWTSWDGTDIGNARDDAPYVSVDFALPDWRLNRKTDMVLSGSIYGQTFELPFAYNPALALANAEQAAREWMPKEQADDEQTLVEIRRAADGAGQVGYVKQSGPIEFTISELSKSGNELYLSVAYKGVNEKNPKIAAMTYYVWWINIDGHCVSCDSTLSDQLNDGVYTVMYKFVLPEGFALEAESPICVKLEMGALDGKVGHDFDDTSDYMNYGYAAFKYNWATKQATLPQDAMQEAEWLSAIEQD